MNYYYVFVYAICVLFGTSLSLPNKPIVGGEPIEIEQFPSLAAVLELQYDEYTYKCGGAILTSYYILTVAQCISGLPLRVRVGSSSHSSGGTVLNVISKTIHADYETLGSDIAVLGLNAPILMNNPAVGQAPLPIQDMGVTVGMTAFVVGWSSEKLSENLQYGILAISDHDQCVNDHASFPSQFEVTDKHICAYNQNVDFCTGGSGSPLFSSGVVVGLAVHTLDCVQTSIPSVYVQVSKHTDWIASVASGVPEG